jgi:predicted MFS family arabinose efflux permease
MELKTETSSLLEHEHKTNFSPTAGNRDTNVSYISVIQTSRQFRLYLLGYLFSLAGDWLTYVASIELIEEMLGPKSAESRRFISFLVVCRLIPNFLLIPFGGSLADGNDRRKNMMFLDFIGAFAPLFYLVAAYFQSTKLVYLATLFQSSIAALYEPSQSSILPMLVTDSDSLNKATTLTGLAWAVMTAIGSGMGGYISALFGFQVCFILDTLSYLMSCFLLYQIDGYWNASNETNQNTSLCAKIEDMTTSGIIYLRNSSFWPLVLLKASTSFVYGGSDVLNVSFAEENQADSEARKSEKLGSLFTAVGIGCLILPLIVERWTKVKDPKTVLNTCIFSFLLQACGCLGQGYFNSFQLTLLFTMLRSGGGNIAWIESQILLQMVVKNDMLGRVVAVDFGLALLSEAASATLAGLLQDDIHLSARQISDIMGLVALAMFVLWTFFKLYCSENALQIHTEHPTRSSKENEEEIKGAA